MLRDINGGLGAFAAAPPGPDPVVPPIGAGVGGLAHALGHVGAVAPPAALSGAGGLANALARIGDAAAPAAPRHWEQRSPALMDYVTACQR